MPQYLPGEALPAQWLGCWIEPAEAVDVAPLQRPAYHLAADVDLVGDVVSARLFATAHGVYEAFVNGTRVGDIELTPGFTAYRSRLQVHAFDVTDLIRNGTNALGFLVSDGWWRGQHGVIREIDAYGPRVGVLAELHVVLADGRRQVHGTDASWRSTTSHVLAADLVAGEVHDQRLRRDDWAKPGTDRRAWHPVDVVDYGYEQLRTTVGPPVRRIEELAPVSIREVVPGCYVVDFGQNSNGWIRLSDLGPVGTEITIRYGEWVGFDGELTQANIEQSFTTRPGVPFQTDRVVSAGDGSTFEPRHSTKGFQYVSIEGHPGPLDAASISSIVVHTDLTPRGEFECSDARINRLHRAAVWSFRSNACELPTDCPTRERSGWVGDWQLYVDTAAYLYDVTEWTAKWLADLAADQWDDGRVTSIVPDPSPHAPMWAGFHGSSGWGDAAVHVPWVLHQMTGRTEILSDQLDSMCRWVEYASGLAAAGRHPSRVERDPEPSPHETYLWDTGWHFGEWLEPGVDIETVTRRLRRDDHGAVATAYLYRSARELAEIAELLERSDLSDRYGALAEHARHAWQAEFIDHAGDITPHTQANLTRALAFDLVPDHLRQHTADRLADLVATAGMHLGTGFLATPFLLPVLADHGHLHTAYNLLFQDSEPSWLHMSDRYSTIWEDWDGLLPDGTAKHSLNHYSKGAVISFLHRYTAGVQLVAPGYSRVRIAPRPGGGIQAARTYHDSPHGRIAVAWRIVDGVGTIDIDLPDPTTGELELPDGSTRSLGPGRTVATWAEGET